MIAVAIIVIVALALIHLHRATHRWPTCRCFDCYSQHEFKAFGYATLYRPVGIVAMSMWEPRKRTAVNGCKCGVCRELR